jgi:nitrogen regulatory protein P-II 2
MLTHARKLLVIIAEAALEKNLVRDARAFGAHGYTLSDVRGGGMHRDREAAWEADRSIEMKVICDEGVAEKLARHVLATYAPNFAVTLFVTDVGVFRPQNF